MNTVRPVERSMMADQFVETSRLEYYCLIAYTINYTYAGPQA